MIRDKKIRDLESLQRTLGLVKQATIDRKEKEGTAIASTSENERRSLEVDGKEGDLGDIGAANISIASYDE